MKKARQCCGMQSEGGWHLCSTEDLLLPFPSQIFEGVIFVPPQLFLFPAKDEHQAA